MYPYHNRIIQRIKNGELLGVEIATGEFAVIFHFKTYPYTRPIRKQAMYRYKDILKNAKIIGKTFDIK